MSYIIPYGSYPIWSISEQQRMDIQNNSLLNFETKNYYSLINRLDNEFVEIIIGRNDMEEDYLNDTRLLNLDYISNYYKNEKVFFTFDKITVYQLVEIFPSYPSPIKFILKRIKNQSKILKNQAFMIMPFRDDNSDFYENNIRLYLEKEHSINIYRADNFRDNDIIIETIYKKIEESEFIIADTTHENKNSFYELGFAAAIRKEIITIQDKAVQHLFFDRSHIRSIFYEKTDVDKFKKDLSSTISTIRMRY